MNLMLVIVFQIAIIANTRNFAYDRMAKFIVLSNYLIMFTYIILGFEL